MERSRAGASGGRRSSGASLRRKRTWEPVTCVLLRCSHVHFNKVPKLQESCAAVCFENEVGYTFIIGWDELVNYKEFEL